MLVAARVGVATSLLIVLLGALWPERDEAPADERQKQGDVAEVSAAPDVERSATSAEIP